MKKRVKWLVKKLLAIGKRRIMRRWPRHVEILSDTEEELIHICEPETRRNLSDEEDKRSYEDIINCQVDRNGILS
jgi:hypothetical protein